MNRNHVAALCRKAIGTQIQILRAHNYTYEEIEEILKLRSASGMTAWRLAGNKHKSELPPEELPPA
jgi:DNA-binding transcriptional MerR regulator